MLSGLMKMEPPSRTEDTQWNLILWEYFSHFVSNNITVCQQFLCNLLKIG